MSTSLTPDLILERLRGVKYPGYSRDIVSFGLVKDVAIDGSRVSLRLLLTTADVNIPRSSRTTSSRRSRRSRRERGRGEARRQRARVQRRCRPRARCRRQRSRASSTSSPSPAARAAWASRPSPPTSPSPCAVTTRTTRVGLCDCDLYGPSMGLMFGTHQRPTADEAGRIEPLHKYDIALMSMGFLLDDATPGHPARADGHALHAAVPAQRELGRARLPRCSICRPARATSSSPSCRPWRLAARSSSPRRRKSR